jgi:hypothetical protein
MKCLNIAIIASISLAVAGLAVGLCAAGYWLKASKIEIDPGWRSGPATSPADALKPIKPTDPQQAQGNWIVATITAACESARLNKVAARLTAAAVVLSALSSVVGALAGCF